jgi:starch phosphorylase
MFASLWPGFDVDELPVTSVTNGVHAQTWLARPAYDFAIREGVNLLAAPTREAFSILDRLTDTELWNMRRQMRADLVSEARRRLRQSCLARGATDAELGWVDDALDPDVLTIGFARRVPSYKRLTLMLADTERLKRLLLDAHRPIQLVIAGKAHPADDGGKKLIQEMVWFSDDPAVRHRIVYLPDYDMALARYLVAGCDVWLNNPLRPLEACGTSGMKAALNGCLNLSIRDGWWDELYDGSNGWAIPTAGGVVDPVRRDELEAAALYEMVESQVVPMFYDRDSDGVPTGWVSTIRRAVTSLGPHVLSSRMLRDYVEQLYLPAAQASRRMTGGGHQTARSYAAWHARVVAGWSAVRVAHVESSSVRDVPQLGDSLHLRAEVELGELSPDDVQVQACTGRTATGEDTLTEVTGYPMRHAGDGGEVHHFEVDVPLERAGAFGYTVRVVPRHELLAAPAELGLVAYP